MDVSSVYDAKEVLKGVISKTPLAHTDKLHGDLWTKAENLQGAGVFRLRGAYHEPRFLIRREYGKGMIAASAGNHAQGVVYPCMKTGVKETTVIPKAAPLFKIEATRSYGVAVELQGDTFNDAYECAKNLQEIIGAVFVEPFDGEYVIAGQGTIGLEILNKLNDVDTVIILISGSGLISGIVATIKAMRPSRRITGVQPEHASSVKQSLKKKEIIKLQNVSVIADGIAIKTLGRPTYELYNRHVDEAVTANEEEIATAMLTLLRKMKMVAEGAGATNIATAMLGKVDPKHHKYITIPSGGNIDVDLLSKTTDLGLMKTGHKAVTNMDVMDRPGNLSHMIELISRAGANIISVNHNRIQNAMLFNQCRVGVIIETNDNEYIEDVLTVLKSNDYDPHLVEHI